MYVLLFVIYIKLDIVTNCHHYQTLPDNARNTVTGKSPDKVSRSNNTHCPWMKINSKEITFFITSSFIEIIKTLIVHAAEVSSASMLRVYTACRSHNHNPCLISG